MKLFWLYSLWLLCLLSVYSAGTSEEMEIVFTASLNGKLEGCFCHDNPSAGLTITGGFIKEKSEAKNVIIDLGDRNAFPYSPVLSEYIEAAYEYIGYDLALYGDQDIQELLVKLDKGSLIEWKNVPDNLFFVHRDNPFQRPYIHDGVPFVFVIEPDIFALYPENVTSGINCTPVRTYVMNFLEEYTGRFILLYHGHIQNLSVLLSELDTDRIPLALIAHEQRVIENALIGKTRVFSPGANANNAGYVKINRNLDILDHALYHFYYSTEDQNPVLAMLYREYKNTDK